MLRLFLAGIGVALGIILAGTAKSQTNPGFNPNQQWCGVQGSIAIRGAANWQCLLPGTGGQALLSGGAGANPVWTTVTGTGTVTSVQASGGTTGLSFSGGPITGSGTLTLAGTLALANGGTGPVGAANTVLKSNGSAASWGQIVNADLTAGTLTNSAISASAAIAPSKFAAQPALSVLANITGGSAVPTTPTVTALLDAAFSTTQGSMLYRNSGGWAAIGPGSAGEFLKTNGAAANPQWQAVTGNLGGTVTTVTLGSGVTGASNPITVTGTITGNAPFRNRLINGDMRLRQRGTPISSGVSTPVYSLDRWYAGATGAAVAVTQSAGSAGYLFNLRVSGAASNTGSLIGQRIESENIYDLASTTVSLSATISCSAITSVGWAAYYPTAIDNYTAKTSISSGTFTVTSTPTRYSTPISLPANVANGLAIEFSIGAMTGGTCDYTGAQLEPGSVVTPFERVTITDAVARAQRYYEKSYSVDTAPTTITNTGIFSAIWGTANRPLNNVGFRVNKRTSPTVAIISPVSGAAGFLHDIDVGGGVAATVSFTGEGGFVYFGATGPAAFDAISGHYTADAEIR